LDFSFISDLPNGFYYNGTNFSWIPSYYDAGKYNLQFSATDNHGGVGYLNVTLTVVNVPFTDYDISTEDIIFSQNPILKKNPLTITTMFRNRLEIDTPTIKVNYYNGTPSSTTFIGQHLIGIDKSMVKSSLFVSQMDWTPSKEGVYNITIWVDPDNEIPEAYETNNIASKIVTVTTRPDIRIRTQDIYFSNNNPTDGDSIQIFANIRNIESVPTGEFLVTFSTKQTNLGNVTANLGPFQSDVVSINWTAKSGNRSINVFVDSDQRVDEMNETNNEASKNITVKRLPITKPQLFVHYGTSSIVE
jgi:hypothetical protein